MRTATPYLFFLVLIILYSSTSRAQKSDVIRDYVEKYKDIAIAEMLRTGVPAAIKLAQGIHETSAGQSDLVTRSNNHFGIKCKTGWSGESVRHTDDAPNECFRKYESPFESYRDHSDFLKNGKRYAFLFALDPTDFEAWAHGLKKAGYATNPKYPQLIIRLIREYNLQDYTMIALGEKIDRQEEILASTGANGDNPGIVQAVQKEIVEPEVRKVNYPAGEFRINETRVIYAMKGTPFISIAQQYNVPLSRLFEFNDDMPEEETVPVDQLIYLQRKRKTGSNEFHVVEKGETIYDIAQVEGIRLESLLAFNHLKEEMDPAVGEKLYLRSKAPAMPQLAMNEGNEPQILAGISAGDISVVSESQSAHPGKTLVHIVQPKEGLYTISKKYGVTIRELQDWNSLNSYALQVGQQLKIYKKP